MYKQILVATDLSTETDFILDKVRGIQVYSGAQLNLVHVVEPLPGYSYAYLGIEDIEEQLIQEARETLAKLGEKLTIPKDHQWIEIGPAKNKILKIADDIQADLIICGSHGRHGLSLLLGSTANAILHGAKCDVLTVRLPDHGI